jgi:hypothetical protein
VTAPEATPAQIAELERIYGKAAVQAWLVDPELRFSALPSQAAAHPRIRDRTAEFIGKGFVLFAPWPEPETSPATEKPKEE